MYYTHAYLIHAKSDSGKGGSTGTSQIRCCCAPDTPATPRAPVVSLLAWLDGRDNEVAGKRWSLIERIVEPYLAGCNQGEKGFEK